MLVRLLIALRVPANVLTLAAVFVVGAIVLHAQDIISGVPALAPTRVEIYGGYAYFHPLGGTIATRPYQPIQPGAVGSVTGYFSRSLGVQLEGGASPKGPNDSIYTLEAGPVLRYSYGRLTPFAHALGGVARVRGPAYQPPTYGWGLTGGVGLDYVLPYFRRRIALRPIQADYQFSHVDYGKLATNGLTGGLGEVKAYRISAGVVFRFGGSLPRERPLVYACSASPSQVFAGDPVTVSGSSTGPATRNRSIYTWEVSGGRVTVTDDTAVIATTDLAPGTYAIVGHLSQGKSSDENASCSESFTVMAPVPPTISCSASPLSIRPGGKAKIISIASSQQNRPLSFSYSSSAGKIGGSSSTETLSVGDAPAGPITVDCRVSDDLGQVAKAEVVVNVSAPPAPVAERRKLCALNFERDRLRPVRVDNEAKACLDEVALALNREAGARLAITGESSAGENASQAMARASNARTYLTKEKGIDTSRIDVKTGKLSNRTAEIELIPVGAPIHYSDDLAPSVSSPLEPAVRPSLDETTAPSAIPAPGYQSSGTIGPRRSADSLVLPPLPPDATAGNRSRARHHASAKRRRHKSAANPASPGNADITKPGVAVGGKNP